MRALNLRAHRSSCRVSYSNQMSTTCASVQSLAGSADGADGTPPDSLNQIYLSRPGTSLTAAASGPCGLVTRRVTSAGIRRVHDRYITSPRQVHDRLNQIQSN